MEALEVKEKIILSDTRAEKSKEMLSDTANAIKQAKRFLKLVETIRKKLIKEITSIGN